MAGYSLSSAAERDLLQIAMFSLERWGEAQAEKYERGLLDLFARLAALPRSGRDASEIRPGLLQSRYESHAVFYRVTKEGIRIVRILHGAMDFTQHL